MNQPSLFDDRGAYFSKCRKYRYVLYRRWNEWPSIVFIGLNPSNANEQTDDPTIRRVIRFAKDWGYGGVIMLNLFAFVTPYPDELLKCPDPVKENNKWLKKYADLGFHIVFAWGSFKEAKKRAEEVIAMFPQAMALKINKDGSPIHPLYVPSKTLPVNFK